MKTKTKGKRRRERSARRDLRETPDKSHLVYVQYYSYVSSGVFWSIYKCRNWESETGSESEGESEVQY